MASDHVPQPYGLVPTGGGVRCTCGADYAIGDRFPAARKDGTQSQRTVKTMKQAWALYRLHYGNVASHAE